MFQILSKSVKGFPSCEVPNWGSSIDFNSRPYNRSALPCCLWSLDCYYISRLLKCIDNDETSDRKCGSGRLMSAPTSTNDDMPHSNKSPCEIRVCSSWRTHWTRCPESCLKPCATFVTMWRC